MATETRWRVFQGQMFGAQMLLQSGFNGGFSRQYIKQARVGVTSPSIVSSVELILWFVIRHVKQAHCGNTYNLFYINYSTCAFRESVCYTCRDASAFSRAVWQNGSNCKVARRLFHERSGTERFGNDQIPELKKKIKKKRFQGAGSWILKVLWVNVAALKEKKKCF